MNLLERFQRWATAWYYVPTIDAMQAQMLRTVWAFHSFSKMSRGMRVSEITAQRRYDFGREFIRWSEMPSCDYKFEETL